MSDKITVSTDNVFGNIIIVNGHNVDSEPENIKVKIIKEDTVLTLHCVKNENNNLICPISNTQLRLISDITPLHHIFIEIGIH